MNYTPAQTEEYKSKAEKWDSLKKEISKFYCSEDGEYSEENPECQGDLTDIGQVAAIHTGWL